MSEIQINKPLYQKRADDSAPVERPAKPLLLARSGAFVLDIMLLHAVFLGLIKFAPAATARLGYAGPWIGFAFAVLYFGVSNSSLARGRSLGKMVLRLLVCDVDGPELPFGRGLLRAFLLLWPLALMTILRLIAEKLSPQDRISSTSMIPIIGMSLAAGWVLGNFLHALVDPFSRTFYDKIMRSAVLSTEAPPAIQADYLREMRETSDARSARKASIFFHVSVVAVAAFGLFNLFMYDKNLKSMPAEDAAFLKRHITGQYVPGFGQPMMPVSIPAGKSGGATTDKAEDTTVILFQYTKRASIDPADVKANDKAMAVVDTLGVLSKERYARALQEGGTPRMSNPKLKMRASFAEFSDLLFAWGANEVIKVDRIVDFTMPETTGTELLRHEQTTATETARTDLLTTASEATTETK